MSILNPRPFVRLPERRAVPIDWPADLADFYATHEGVGLESTPERSVRLCRLDEVQRVIVADMRHFCGDDPAWANFAGYQIGFSPFFDRVVYVLSAPVCQRGAILVFGYDIAGPGGFGSAVLEGELLLAETLANWLAHLEQCGWDEPGFYPGSIEEPMVRAYYRRLNPAITW